MDQFLFTTLVPNFRRRNTYRLSKTITGLGEKKRKLLRSNVKNLILRHPRNILLINVDWCIQLPYHLG
jgi:hypothetical protein